MKPIPLLQGAALTLSMDPCEQSILDKCARTLDTEEQSLVASCTALWEELDSNTTACRQLVTPDCACFRDIREKKEIFKRDCREQGKTSYISMVSRSKLFLSNSSN